MMEKSAVVEHAWENHHRLGGDHSAGPRQRTGLTVAEGGPANPDDTLGGALKLGSILTDL